MKKRKITLFSTCFVFWLVSIIFGKLIFSDDDLCLNFIAAGAYGPDSQYMIYSNILFGYFLKILYSIFPMVNCYLWFYLIGNLFSVFICSYIISHKLSDRAAIATCFVMNALLFKDYYLNLEYTKNATFYGITGFLILIHVINAEKIRWRNIVIASVFISFGCLCRGKAFLSIVPGFALALAFLIFMKKEKLKRALIVFIPLFLCIIYLSADYYAYRMNADWNYFTEWNRIMTLKRDYGDYAFQWDSEEYVKAGITKVDFEMMDKWMCNDVEYFTLEKLQTMDRVGAAHKLDNPRLSMELVDDSFDAMGKDFTFSVLPLSFVIIAVFALIFARKKLKLYILADCLFVFADYYYLSIGRRFRWHAECGIWLAAIMFALFFIMTFREKDILPKLFYIIIPVVASAYILGTNVYSFTHEKQGKVVQDPDGTYYLFDELRNRDNLYVVGMMEAYLGLCGAENIFSINKADYKDYFYNTFNVGGWQTPSPLSAYYPRLNGINSPIKALPDREDLYYVDDGEDMGYMLVYLQEKYGPEIQVDWVEDICDTSVWKFHR